MEFLMDPSGWIGLITLIILEIILGVDNLMFITILSDKLSPKQRNKARLISLSLVLIMRLALLSIISWMVTLTKPLFSIFDFTFSWRSLIMLFGGIFLLFKATNELHERLENNQHNFKHNKNYASFWSIVFQIVILDAVFSLDAIITAVGIINQIKVIMIAVIIATVIMLLAAKALATFVNRYPTVVVLCLSFLIMIGFSLVAEGFGLFIPKGYLYAAISFSVVIELFNQIARYNYIKHQSDYINTKFKINKFINVNDYNKYNIKQYNQYFDLLSNNRFIKDKKYTINDIFLLTSSIKEIMIPRDEISWININLSVSEIRKQLISSPYDVFPVCNGKLDKIIGVMRAKEILIALDDQKNIEAIASTSTAILALETLNIINILDILNKTLGNCIIIINDIGIVKGLITSKNLLKIIYYKYLDEQETLKNIFCRDMKLIKKT